jgi:hypothetical protein
MEAKFVAEPAWNTPGTAWIEQDIDPFVRTPHSAYPVTPPLTQSVPGSCEGVLVELTPQLQKVPSARVAAVR